VSSVLYIVNTSNYEVIFILVFSGTKLLKSGKNALVKNVVVLDSSRLIARESYDTPESVFVTSKKKEECGKFSPATSERVCQREAAISFNTPSEPPRAAEDQPRGGSLHGMSSSACTFDASVSARKYMKKCARCFPGEVLTCTRGACWLRTSVIVRGGARQENKQYYK